MKRYFNTTGRCVPDKHYMVPPFRNMDDEVIRLIEAEQYFLIHAPRQTGKTTFLHALAKRLNEEGKYVSVACSVKPLAQGLTDIDLADSLLSQALHHAIANTDASAIDQPDPQFPSSFSAYLQEPRVRKVVNAVIEGGTLFFDGYDDAVRYCRDLGLVTQDRPIQFSNPIYREIITRILNQNLHDGFDADTVSTSWYLDAAGRLQIDKLLDAFVAFYRRHSESWLERFDYKEAGHQLLLMAFLQRIVNGGGRIEREMAVGNGRTDLAIFWKDQVIPIEIKLHHDTYIRKEGLRQLGRYMDKLGQQRGHLVIFEKQPSTVLPWEQRIRRETVQAAGREMEIWWM
ncbi:MAG: hypothetical protein OHK0039_08390 [Bacteroidia bacterium]